MIRPADHKRVVEAAKTFCPRCQVPYGVGSCEHRAPFAAEAATEAAAAELVRRHGPEGARFKLLVTIWRIAFEEEHKQRVRNAQHALRYRRQGLAPLAKADGGIPPRAGSDKPSIDKPPSEAAEAQLAEARRRAERHAEWASTCKTPVAAVEVLRICEDVLAAVDGTE